MLGRGRTTELAILHHPFLELNSIPELVKLYGSAILRRNIQIITDAVITHNHCIRPFGYRITDLIKEFTYCSLLLVFILL